MNEPAPNSTSRRGFIKTTGTIAAVSAFAGMVIPNVHAADDQTLQIALVGCGGRGSGAAVDALNVKRGPVKLVAMADVFQDRLDSSYEGIKRDKVGHLVDVPDERKFIGFDAYKKAMDCLKPGDIVILTTPLAFRWVHYTYAIEKKLNVFMEKPLTADGPCSRRMLKLAEEASAKNLKCAVGLMSRHARHLQELKQRIEDGELGDIVLMRGYRVTGPGGSAFSTKWPGQPNELLWQIRRFHSFIWASGGLFNDFYVHHVDHLCWMKGSWPVEAQALGGRHYRNSPEGNRYVDQNFDSYSVEYTFEDGGKMIMDGRCITGCNDIYSSYVHGTKAFAIAAHDGDCSAPSSIYTGLKADRAKRTWLSKEPPGEENPYRNEWNDLVDAIRDDKPYNEVPRGVYASLTGSLGRKAAHTGQKITFQEMLNSEQEYAPGVDKFTMDSPPPVTHDEHGLYPIPEPGIKRHNEY
jgi:predicted dehydrogenase